MERRHVHLVHREADLGTFARTGRSTIDRERADWTTLWPPAALVLADLGHGGLLSLSDFRFALHFQRNADH